LRGKTHDKVKSILEIKSEDIANDDQEVATSSPAVENQEAAG